MLDAEWPEEILESELCKEIRGSTSQLLYRGISVRMGAHYGPAIAEEDKIVHRMDYFGVDVILSSRICNTALGGELLVSESIYQIFQTTPSNEKEDIDLVFFNLGQMELKGLAYSEPIYSVYPRILSERYGERAGRKSSYTNMSPSADQD
jgi:adenylate cyclase